MINQLNLNAKTALPFPDSAVLYLSYAISSLFNYRSYTFIYRLTAHTPPSPSSNPSSSHKSDKYTSAHPQNTTRESPRAPHSSPANPGRRLLVHIRKKLRAVENRDHLFILRTTPVLAFILIPEALFVNAKVQALILRLHLQEFPASWP